MRLSWLNDERKGNDSRVNAGLTLLSVATLSPENARRELGR
ncbi:hypothetical protein [uncultured Ferrimonas sp.]|nr:hypothetical protein [uncultured Ferrimonas sp.]